MKYFNKFVVLLFVLLIEIISAKNFSDSTVKMPVPAQDKPLKFNLSDDGSRWFQVTFLNQTWARYNNSNLGTTVKGDSKTETFDIGLRRTRIQMFGQITDRAFLYFQFGQNNFNYLTNIGGNRKIGAFFHDALCEYRLSTKNQLKIGGGLTIANGLSRFSQPSIGTIATLDVPVFAQATVDQIDMFSRKLSLYARGQIGKFDYRFVFSQPFSIASSGANSKISKDATFSDSSHYQYQTYIMYQFFDQEGHTTPYMTGTYLGSKKIFNIATGAIIQNKATKRYNDANEIVYDNMKLFCVESFLDVPLNKDKQTAINAYLGYFNTNYGKNYLRYNGIMNPADGIKSGLANSQGNAFPMMGTGSAVYTQFAYLLPKKWFGSTNSTKVSVYGSSFVNKFDKVGKIGAVHSLGFNCFLNAHKVKLSVEMQNRPTYLLNGSSLNFNSRKSCYIVQYQIFI